MGVKVFGAALGAALWLGGPALAGVQVALVAPLDSSAPEVQIDAVVLSPAGQAIQAELARKSAGNNRVEATLLEEVRAFYASRNYEPLWIAGGRPSWQMSGLRLRMNRASEEGLDPAEYPTPAFAQTYPDDPASVATADVQFSRTVVRYILHISTGRLDPSSISPLITRASERPPAAEILAKMSRTAGVAAAIARYDPPQPEFSSLKAELAELRGQTASAPVEPVPDGKTLRPGMSDPRVPVLRRRLAVSADPAANPELFDAALADALRAFQTTHGMPGDGVLGARTTAALNGGAKTDRVATVLVNMERWRWMPRDLGNFHVSVNVPEFMVRVVDDGAVVHETRVVVGKPDTPTPLFSQPMDHLVVNPYWNVPTSIVKKEMLSSLQSDPYGYVTKHNYQVLAQAGGKMQVVDPGSVDWSSVNPRTIRIRQVPGDDNALGRIKFMFPNQYDVYLHDTPSRKLFAKDFRAFSHGCVRVDNPMEFADSILTYGAPKWNAKRLEKLFGGAERWVSLDKPIPVHIAYFTATTGQDGSHRWFDDVYGLDHRMEVALGL